MPTAESSAAFARLVAARERLTEVTKLLNEAKANAERGENFTPGLRGTLAEQEKLQASWEEAYAVFAAATDEFHRIVHSISRPKTSG